MSIRSRFTSALALACVLGFHTAAEATTPTATVDGYTITGERMSAAVPGGFDGARYLGIPYATAERWKAPVAYTLDQNISALQEGAPCPQDSSPLGRANTTNEDCLFLNIYQPVAAEQALANPTQNPALPVMVWIHGGGLIYGEGALYDAQELADQGVIVLTFNYRLGILGFLAHEAFQQTGAEICAAIGLETNAECSTRFTDNTPLSGNYGFYDQVAVLKWVQNNIAAFGGNPSNVTLFGQSAGGLSVLTHLGSKLSTGMFHRAIVQSGGYGLVAVPDLAGAKARGKTFMDALLSDTNTDCSAEPSEASCLVNQLSTETLVLNQREKLPLPAGETASLSFFPNIDGFVLENDLLSLYFNGDFNQMPVMLGTTKDEYRYFVASDVNMAGGKDSTSGQSIVWGSTATNDGATIGLENSLGAVLTDGFGFNSAGVPDLIDELIDEGWWDDGEYNTSDYNSPSEMLGAVVTDLLFACTSSLATTTLGWNASVFEYEFNVPNTPQYILTDANGTPDPRIDFPMGSYHGSELPYLFDLSQQYPASVIPPGSDMAVLKNTMMEYWASFAADGSPNTTATLGPIWWEYIYPFNSYLSLATPQPVTENDYFSDHHCWFWADYLAFSSGDLF